MLTLSPSPLLERDDLLQALTQALHAAADGHGRTVLVSGEAGIGKTSLLEHFVRALGDGVTSTNAPLNATPVFWGGCEALSTPRPLGPVHDWAQAGWQRLQTLLETDIGRAPLFTSIFDELSRAGTPAVVVFEDVHWADEATLDLIKFIGRRIQRVPLLMVLSCRDDDAAFERLRPTLGDLPASALQRLAVPRLSRSAVGRMADLAAQAALAGVGGGLHAGLDANFSADLYANLFEGSGGNPFFVTEMLRHPRTDGGLPSSLRDAVLGRAAGLSPSAMDVLQLTAVVPRAVALSLVTEVLGSGTHAIEQCLHSGLLLAEGHQLRFRHELARAAVEQAMLRPRAIEWHARVLAALQARPDGSVPLAQLAHHAKEAGAAQAVLRLAPRAAHEAALRGARREAAAHCESALAYAASLPDQAHADLLDLFATHCFELGDLDRAIATRQRAIALYERVGATEQQCQALAALAMPLVRALRNAEADAASAQAIALAEGLGLAKLQATACATEAYLRMLNRDYQEAVSCGQQTIALATALNDRRLLARAHNAVGAALLFVDYPRGCDHVLKSLAIARELEDGDVSVADAYVMLGTGSGEVFEFEAADRYLGEGLAFARAHDLDRLANYMQAWQSLSDLYQGRWEAAGEHAHRAVEQSRGLSTNRVTALLALGRLRTRRGDPGAVEPLEEALTLARRSGTLQRLAPVCAARAEAAWLQGDRMQARDEAAAAFDLARRKGHPWFLGELAYWLWRAGVLAEPPQGCAEPYRLQMRGQWHAAAQAWGDIGCPYEQARALADGDEEAQRGALTILDRLGARPLAEHLRQHMRSAGIKSVPRGPSHATRGNAAGLTAREVQVLSLIAEGCRNAQIADRLSRSLRTVDHHVEAILDKLGAESRASAVSVARTLGLLPKNG